MPIRVLLIIAFSFIFWQPVAHAKVTIVAFGDSLMSGHGIPKNQAYPAQLQTYLHEKGQTAVEVINASVSGDTTSGGRGRVESILSHAPDLVILELGINDIFRSVPLKSTYQNLKHIIKFLLDNEVRIILMGMKAPPNYGAKKVATFEQMYHELAKQFYLPFYPFFLEDVAGVPALNNSDRIHPNVLGVQKMVENTGPLLHKAVKQYYGSRAE